MTDEAAVPRRPATGDDIGPAQPDPVPSAPAPGSPPEGFPDDETTSVFEPREASGPPPTSGPPPGPGSPPPPGYGPPPPNPTAFTSRYGFVRPKDGRYLAGVCAAIGRATNTDPILWRVLLAVLGFFGGIGILIYVAAWLIIPGEGDTASPVESMLGRGRSSMSPTTVLVLAITVAVIFGFIVTDGFRAILLGAAILIGGALLLNRNAIRGQVPNAGAPTPSGGPGPAYAPTAGGAPMPTGAPTPFGMAQMGHPGLPPQPGTGPVHPGQPHSGAGYPPPVPPTGPYPPMVSPPVSSGYPAVGQPSVPYPAAPVPSSPGAPTQPLPGWPTATQPAVSAPPTGRPPGPMPPSSGYRPPFAPHGPFAPHRPHPPGAAPQVKAPKPAKPPKPPRERSSLGAATFSLIFVALGAVAILHLSNVISVSASAYFAAALATIGLGLLVGAWFGRARWLIALGLVAAAALGTVTLVESYTRVRNFDGNVTWTPTSHELMAQRYENNFGDAVLDLTQVSFTDRETRVTAVVTFGNLTVIVPPNVDVTAIAEIKAGDAGIFGTRWSGVNGPSRQVTDLGADGAGGGKLRLNLHVNAGNLEVIR